MLGVPLAWVLARSRIRGRSVLRALVTVPLVLPPVVGGVALFLVLGRQGIIGSWLDDAFGITIPFTTAAVVIAETFVAMPFLVISVEGALRAADARFEDVAATLGADRWTTFRRVTLPMVAPGVAAGAVLCWARALGEFGATITFAGNFPGTTQTMPLAVYLALQRDPEAAIVLSLVLLAVSLATLLLLRDRWLGRAVAVTPRRRRSRVAPRAPSHLRRRPRGGRRRGARRPRAERRGQVHAAARARRPARPRTAARSPSTAPSLGRRDGVHVPAHRRPLGIVFQDALLFPHLTRRRERRVRPAHPRRAEGGRPQDGRGGVADPGRPRRARRPPSGRSSPAGRRSGRRWPGRWSATRRCCCSTSRCRRWTPAPGSTSAPSCAGTWPSSRGSTVLVTHDPVDAMALADRVVVVEDGRVVQTGTPVEVSRRPRTDYVARLVGLSLLPGTGEGRSVRLDGGGVVAVAEEAARPGVRRRPPRVGRALPGPARGQPAQRLAGPAGRRDAARGDGALRAGRRGAAGRRRHRDRVRRAGAGARRATCGRR